MFPRDRLHEEKVKLETPCVNTGLIVSIKSFLFLYYKRFKNKVKWLLWVGLIF